MSDTAKGVKIGVGVIAGGCGCLVLFCLLIGGCLMIVGTGVQEMQKEQERVELQEAERVQQTEEVIVISANDLMQDCTDNKIAAEMKYKGKVLVVNGIIQSMGNDVIGKMPHVKLKTGHIIASVHCSFRERDRENLSTLQTGQSISIRGMVDSIAGDVWLKNCSIER